MWELTEINSSARGAAGGSVYHAITADIPLDIALKALFCETRGESGSELESRSEALFSGSGSVLRDSCWGGAMRLGAE